jgi:hypothetical protein
VDPRLARDVERGRRSLARAALRSSFADRRRRLEDLAANQIVELCDVRVMQPRGQLCLLDQHADQRRLGGQVGAQRLDPDDLPFVVDHTATWSACGDSGSLDSWRRYAIITPCRD